MDPFPAPDEELPPGDLFPAIENGKRDYGKIILHGDFRCDQIDTHRDVNIVIGCCGRPDLLRATVLHLKKSLGSTDLRVSIVVSEMGSEPLFRDFAADLGVEYLFIPFEASDTENKHSEALSQSLAYFCIRKSQWYCFHCADIVVPEDWLARLEVLLKKNRGFIQPYSGKKLQYLSPEYSQMVVEANGTTNIRELEASILSGSGPGLKKLDNHQSIAGNTGGSIFVTRNDFEQVGGFEPEIFFGWGWEDILLWSKLEFLYALFHKQDMSELYSNNNFHQGNATYPEHPLLVFHLYHEPSEQATNMMDMRLLSHCFYRMPYFDKLKYMRMKRGMLAEDLKEVNRFMEQRDVTVIK